MAPSIVYRCVCVERELPRRSTLTENASLSWTSGRVRRVLLSFLLSFKLHFVFHQSDYIFIWFEFFLIKVDQFGFLVFWHEMTSSRLTGQDWETVMIPVVGRRMNSSSLAPPLPRRSDFQLESSSFCRCVVVVTFAHRHGIGLESSCRLDSATCTFRGQFTSEPTSVRPSVLFL